MPKRLSALFKAKQSKTSHEQYTRNPRQESGPDRGLDGGLDEGLRWLIAQVKDYQITHGSLLKLVRYEQDHTVPNVPVGASLIPTVFPRRCFDEACAMQEIFNRLYVAVAEDDEWLEKTLSSTIKSDPMIASLWNVHRTVQAEGPAQDLNLGIFRSDYMLHFDRQIPSPDQSVSIKQVEINTFNVAGGVHGNIVTGMHSHLSRSNAYAKVNELTEKLHLPSEFSIQENKTLDGIVGSLTRAHRAFCAQAKASQLDRCILMVVQPFNINICDERPIEYGLWDQGVPTFRLTFGRDFLLYTALDDDRRLIYTPPVYGRSLTATTRYEVSVVYLRAGHEPAEYSETIPGEACRLRVERSTAIKCPPITTHLTTLKVVQEALTKDGELERFVSSEEASRLRKVFMYMQGLDDSKEGHEASDIALDPASAIDYVLKPSLEGGGNNIFRSEITTFLARTSKEQWANYVLMRMMDSPQIGNVLISPAGVHQGPVISELGIFGFSLWRSNQRNDGSGPATPDFVFNEQGGWSFKTKSQMVDEMSVVKGYGCFDSPLLLDDDQFAEYMPHAQNAA